MFGGGSAPTPPPPPLPDPLPSAPTYASGLAKGPTGQNNAKTSFGSTIMTSPLGDLAPTNTSKKSLLGQ